MRLRPKSGVGGTGLTSAQHMELMVGFTLCGEQGFENQDAMRKAWWKFRTQLMVECEPLSRPFGFWQFEVDGYYPNCKRTNYELEENALLRLGLELTPEEKSILVGQAPHSIPETVPVAAIEHWGQVLRSLEIRRDWHQREGRTTQANAWDAQAHLLLARLVEAGYCPQATWPPKFDQAVLTEREIR